MSRELYLNPEFAALWRDREPFAAAFALEGEVFRAVKNRRTLRFELDGRGYFVKLHRGVGWREIFKNLFQLKLPVLGAGNEYRAIRLLEQLGIRTMAVAAYGSRGWNPATRESFIVTAELSGMISLEEYGERRAALPEFRRRRALIRALGELAGKMHRAGLNHRDCYLCHFLLAPSPESAPELYVLDLHRAQIRRRPSRRYVVKDVAGIWFSSMDLGLSRTDLAAFRAAYGPVPDRRFWRDVDRTARRLYRKIHGREPERLAKISETATLP